MDHPRYYSGLKGKITKVFKICEGKLICEESYEDHHGGTHYIQKQECSCWSPDPRDTMHTIVLSEDIADQMECCCYECRGQSYTEACKVPGCYWPRWYNKKKERHSLTCSKTCAKKLGTWHGNIY